MYDKHGQSCVILCLCVMDTHTQTHLYHIMHIPSSEDQSQLLLNLSAATLIRKPARQ